MSGSLRNDKIVTFARNVLGCGCPDEVFNKIEVSDIDLEPVITDATRIVIGNTLLIYILPNGSVDVVADNLGKLVAAGKQDRDLHGYNRFRLVMPSSDRKGLEEKIGTAFSAEARGDEKLHVHFVDEAALRGLSGM